MSLSTMESLYHDWRRADDVWQLALANEFGKDAYSARFAPKGLGVPGSDLRRAYDAFARTGAAFYDAGGAGWLSGKHMKVAQ